MIPSEKGFLEALRRTRILRPPKHQLATFGTTTLQYVLLSPVENNPDVCRLREGDVTAQRPVILTPEIMRKRFEGFGDDLDAFQESIERAYGETLRGLEYTFKNELRTTSLENTPPAELAERAKRLMDQEDAPRKALLEGPDQGWSLAVMKFILDTSMRSFPSNLKELDERGQFDPGQRAVALQRREIETLFMQALRDRAAISRLGEYLQKTGLFTEYEDRFFALVGR